MSQSSVDPASDSPSPEKVLSDHEQKAVEPNEPPDGGSKAWLTVAGAFLASFVSFGWGNCIGVFQAEYERNILRDYSGSSISWITSMQTFFTLFMSPLAGALFDSYGPKVPMVIGSIMEVFGLMMLSLSKDYYQIMLSQSVCSGIGLSLIFTPAIAAPQTWFTTKRAVTVGLAIAGASVGGVVFPFMVQHLIPQVGFPWTIRICAFMILGLLIIAVPITSSYSTHTKKPLTLAVYLRPMRERNFQILLFACFFLYWGMFIPFNYIVTNAEHRGMSPSTAFTLVPIMNGASFFGRTIPNYVAAKIGRYNVMIVMLVLSAILCLGLWLPGSSNGALYSYAALFGFSSGAGIGLAAFLISGISPMKELGYRMGTFLAVGAIASLTGSPIAGAIVARTGGSYTWACAYAGLSFVVSTIGMAAIRVRLGGWKLAVKV